MGAKYHVVGGIPFRRPALSGERADLFLLHLRSAENPQKYGLSCSLFVGFQCSPNYRWALILYWGKSLFNWRTNGDYQLTGIASGFRLIRSRVNRFLVAAATLLLAFASHAPGYCAVVINEIHYNPPAPDGRDLEFVELFNFQNAIYCHRARGAKLAKM